MRTQGIVLKTMPYREFDELVVCYTAQEGKQLYQAKSILRSTSKQRNTVNVLNLIDFDIVPGKAMPILISAQTLENFSDIRQSLPALALAFLALESFDRLVFENEPDGQLWEYLLSYLHHLNHSAQTSDQDWSLFESKYRAGLMSVLGYPSTMNLEEIINAQMRSSSFLRHVVK